VPKIQTGEISVDNDRMMIDDMFRLAVPVKLERSWDQIVKLSSLSYALDNETG